ncbi:hypothetical protein F4780DRAFT_717289 [Xylariomycetidae sp. FL0641]|nr:hypothetical protein F4780DRAFT_717289 [Xylariomycetidae sp. FL0641]
MTRLDDPAAASASSLASRVRSVRRTRRNPYRTTATLMKTSSASPTVIPEMVEAERLWWGWCAARRVGVCSRAARECGWNGDACDVVAIASSSVVGAASMPRTKAPRSARRLQGSGGGRPPIFRAVLEDPGLCSSGASRGVWWRDDVQDKSELQVNRFRPRRRYSRMRQRASEAGEGIMKNYTLRAPSPRPPRKKTPGSHTHTHIHTHARTRAPAMGDRILQPGSSSASCPLARGRPRAPALR